METAFLSLCFHMYIESVNRRMQFSIEVTYRLLPLLKPTLFSLNYVSVYGNFIKWSVVNSKYIEYIENQLRKRKKKNEKSCRDYALSSLMEWIYLRENFRKKN